MFSLFKRSNAPQSVEQPILKLPPSGTVLGKYHATLDALIDDKEANLHILTLGATGSGKTVTISKFVTSAIRRGIPVIYVDGKGDTVLGQKLANYADKWNRRSWLFDMNAGSTLRYNPLSSGGITSKKDRIIEMREWSEPYYKTLAEGYLQMIFKMMDLCGVKIDLATTTKYLSIPAIKAELRKHFRGDAYKQLDKEVHLQEKAQEHALNVKGEIENLINSEIGGAQNAGRPR